MIRRASVLSAAVTAALALPTAVVFAGGGASAAPVVSSALPAVAAADISVTGVGVATYPAFDPSVSRYAITTGPTTECNPSGTTPNRSSAAAQASATKTTTADGRSRGFHFPLGLNTFKSVLYHEMGIPILERNFGGPEQGQILHASG